MREYKNIIIGAGYSGLNAYYTIKNKKNTLLMDSNGVFIYHSKTSDIKINIPSAVREKVVKINMNNYSVETDEHEYHGENIVIATGCSREEQIRFMDNAQFYGNHYIASENEFDDYILLQYILKLNKTGIKAGYSGNFMRQLGENVAITVKNFLKTAGISISPEHDFIFPRCKPALFKNFLKVDRNFKVKDGIYAVGDIVESDIKLGELAMREGTFVGSRINGVMNDFKPVFISILDNFDGSGIRIKSKYPWGIEESSAHTGYIYSLMSAFLSKYYRTRRGKMGIISHF